MKESANEKVKKDLFIDALNKELCILEKSGRISSEQVEEKRKSAALIETGFSNDPKNDALLFSVADIAGEKELIDIFTKNKSKENKKR